MNAKLDQLISENRQGRHYYFQHKINPEALRVYLFAWRCCLNVHEYADLIHRCIGSCQFIENPPHYVTKLRVFTNPDRFYWSDVLLLHNDLCLKVEDSARFSGDEMTIRNFSYDLRRRSAPRRLIWRIDSHSDWHPISDPCHIHINPDNDDERLEFFKNSQGINFLYVMHCLKNQYENKPQEWEVK